MMRLYHASPLSGPHESVEDCTIGGYHVSAGTRLLFNISKLHWDPRAWLDPLKFWPERFLTTHKDLDVRGQDFALQKWPKDVPGGVLHSSSAAHCARDFAA
ncbi:hypothetical protein NL676_025766 [Syzygium grande]|nr:hypothetical protein NL676_025766 [Syzygium grande]